MGITRFELGCVMSGKWYLRPKKGYMSGWLGPELHLQHIHEVLCVLWRDKFFVVIKKCIFISPQVLFISYVVSGDGLKVDESNIEAIRQWP